MAEQRGIKKICAAGSILQTQPLFSTTFLPMLPSQESDLLKVLFL